MDVFLDAFDPLPHRFSRDFVEKLDQLVEQLTVLLEIVEMLIDPMLQDVQHPELDGLTVLLAEPLHVLGHPPLIVVVAVELRVRDDEPLDQQIQELVGRREASVHHEERLHEHRIHVDVVGQPLQQLDQRGPFYQRHPVRPERAEHDVTLGIGLGEAIGVGRREPQRMPFFLFSQEGVQLPLQAGLGLQHHQRGHPTVLFFR